MTGLRNLTARLEALERRGPDEAATARQNLRDLGAALGVVVARLDGEQPPALDEATLTRLRTHTGQTPHRSLLGEFHAAAARVVCEEVDR
jgi:hypothetical protein